jgi:hypothetical protein
MLSWPLQERWTSSPSFWTAPASLGAFSSAHLEFVYVKDAFCFQFSEKIERKSLFTFTISARPLKKLVVFFIQN